MDFSNFLKNTKPFTKYFMGFVILLTLLDRFMIVPFLYDALIYEKLFQLQVKLDHKIIWTTWVNFLDLENNNHIWSCWKIWIFLPFPYGLHVICEWFENCSYFLFSHLEKLIIKKAEFAYLVFIVALLCLVKFILD